MKNKVPKNKLIGVRVPPELHKKITEYAEKEARTVSNFLLYKVIIPYLEKN